MGAPRHAAGAPCDRGRPGHRDRSERARARARIASPGPGEVAPRSASKSPHDRQSDGRDQEVMAPRQEIEIKLRADPAKLAAVKRSRWWRALEPARREALHSIYFDTSDWQL